MKHLLVVGLALTLVSVTAGQAQTDLPPPEQLFRPNETSIDLFGTITVDESTLDRFSPEPSWSADGGPGASARASRHLAQNPPVLSAEITVPHSSHL